MSDFVDPLTQASSNSTDDEDDLFKGEKSDDKESDADSEEDDIFDAEGKTEIQESPDDGVYDQKPTAKTVEEYILDDEQDLFISVDKPEKHISSMETFISYQIVTKTSRSSFDDSEYSVRRRYQDFVWLREKLEESHPTHLIPPLPAKFVVKGMVDRFSPSFVGTRSRALDSFLKRIAEHPVVSFNEHLKVFLTSNDFTSLRKQSQPGVFSRVGGTVKAAAAVGSVIRSRPRESPFAEMSEHVSTFREKMAVTDRVAERLLNEERELVNDLREYGPTYAAWAASEDRPLSTIMTAVSKAIETCAEAAEKNAENHQLYFIPPLKEYMLYADSIEQVFRRRDAMQGQRDRCSEELKRKKEEKENLPRSDQSYSFGAMLGRNPEEVRQQKEEKLDQQIQEVTERFENLSDNLEKANGDLKSDMERWKFNKKQDMKQVFTQLADSHIAHQSQCLSAWESIIPLMRGELDSVGGDDDSVILEQTSVSNENADET